MIWRRGEFLVADGGWITTRQTTSCPAGCSKFLDRQPGKPGWLATVFNLTAGRRLVQQNGGIGNVDEWPRYCGASPCVTSGVFTRSSKRPANFQQMYWKYTC